MFLTLMEQFHILNLNGESHIEAKYFVGAI